MIMCDSSIEKKFAKDLMENKDVKCFIKLPGWQNKLIIQIMKN